MWSRCGFPSPRPRPEQDALQQPDDGNGAQDQAPPAREAQKIFDGHIEPPGLLPHRPDEIVELRPVLSRRRGVFPLYSLDRQADGVQRVADLVRRAGGELAHGGQSFGLVQAVSEVLDPSQVAILVGVEKPHGQNPHADHQPHGQKDVAPVFAEQLIYAARVEPYARCACKGFSQADGLGHFEHIAGLMAESTHLPGVEEGLLALIRRIRRIAAEAGDDPPLAVRQDQVVHSLPRPRRFCA